MGLGITTEGATTAINFKTITEEGIGAVVELFANRPDLWGGANSREYRKNFGGALVEADNGMLKIDLSVLNGLVTIGDDWYAGWQSLSQDVVDELNATALVTDDGLLKIEKITKDTKIPDNVNDYVIKPFNSLPAEIKEKLTGGDASVMKSLEGSEVLITNATKVAFEGAVTEAHNQMVALQENTADDAGNIGSDMATAFIEGFKKIEIEQHDYWR